MDKIGKTGDLKDGRDFTDFIFYLDFKVVTSAVDLILTNSDLVILRW